MCVLRPDSLYKGVNDVDGRHDRLGDEKAQGLGGCQYAACVRKLPRLAFPW